MDLTTTDLQAFDCIGSRTRHSGAEAKKMAEW